MRPLRFHARPLSAPIQARARLLTLISQRGEHVTPSGDLSGHYVVVEKRDDRSLVIAPETSLQATLIRDDLERATVEEFQAEFDPLQRADGEG